MNTPTIRSINTKTDNNDHTGALLELSRLLGMKDESDTIEEIEMCQELIGYMTPDLIGKRNTVQRTVYACAKTQTSETGASIYSLLR